MTPEQDEMMNLLTALESNYVEYSESEPFPNAANDAYSAMVYGVGNHAQELLTLVREQQAEIERVRQERDGLHKQTRAIIRNYQKEMEFAAEELKRWEARCYALVDNVSQVLQTQIAPIQIIMREKDITHD